MGLHKLTAGDGYSYLTRQVAVHDATDKGHTGLADYYAQRGESPGVWLGAGLAGLDGVDPGDVVTAEQMKALFGEGRHPNATGIERSVLAAGGTAGEALQASALGKAFAVFAGANGFQTEVARRFTTFNTHQGHKWNAPIPPEVRAAIRTEVGRAMFADTFGREVGDARELSGFIARASRQATKAVAGYDLTFSPVKSVSALWAIAPRDVADEIEQAHHAAVADTIRYLEREVAFTREGRAGVQQVAVRGLVAAGFTHRDSRAGDPDLHTHVAVSNKVQTLDGRWLALDGRVLFAAKVSASEHYNTVLEAELTDRLHITFTNRPDADVGKRAVREITGIDERLLRVWSRRRAAIDVHRGVLAARFQVEHGRPPTAVEALHLAQQATLETRQDKHPARSHAEQRAAWRAEAITVLGRAGLRRMLTRLPHPTTPPPAVTDRWIAATADTVLHVVSGSRATWQVWHVRAEAHRQARAAGIGRAELPRAVEGIVAAALDPQRSLPLGVPDPIHEPAPLRRRDGMSVYSVAGAQHYTSAAVLDAEQQLVAAAQRRDGRRIPDAAVELGLLEAAAHGTGLNDLQAHLVRELATSGARVQVAIAPAGSGKTTALRVLASAWTDNGGHILGLAPSAAAAAALRAEIGAHTDTLAKLTHTLTHPDSTGGPVPGWVRDIGPRTLVLIDEAAMAGTADLAHAVDFVIGRGGSVRLVGDDQQLASVAAGGVLRDIADTAGVITLSQLMRFTDRAEAAATLAVRAGDRAGIGFYLDHARVHVGDDTTATDHAYQAWAADRHAGLDAVILAPTRDLAATLNRRARADRLAQHGLAGREVTLGDGNQASTGDVIVTRRNDRRLTLSGTDWIKNGDRCTITAVHPDGTIKVAHHDTGRRIVLPTEYVATHTALGYASTVHAAQGITADTCHTVLTGQESRQLLYVALTRGRNANHVYLATAADGDPHTVIRPETLIPPTAGDILATILDRDQAQRSATTLTRELAHPALLLREAVARYHDALGYAAEHHLGPQVMAGIDTAANTLRPGLTDGPAYPTLRAHLALLAAHGRDPITTLIQAFAVRELGDAIDPAAVLDWRLPPTDAGAGAGPLPWLPPIPTALSADPRWGAYLTARADRVRTLAGAVTDLADQYAPTSAPGWAARLLDPAHQQLRRDLAVWRAATGTPDHDTRPAGPPHPATAAAAHQTELTRRVARILGDPTQHAETWAALADRLEPRLRHDEYWPQLADRLAALDRASLNPAALLRSAVAERPLPDEQPAAALWWRIAAHLSPATVTATTRSGAATLRPTWTATLDDAIGAARAERVLADPAWPTLVAAVTTAVDHGWTAEDVLHTAAELAHLKHPHTTTGSIGTAELATALAWRVTLLTDPTPPPTDHLPDEPPDAAVAPRHDPDHTDRRPHADRGAERAAVPVDATPDRQPASARQVPPARLLELNQQAAQFFTDHYPSSWAADHMRERLGSDLIGNLRFSPGYAPPGWTQLTTHLRTLGADDAELLAAGLARLARSGRVIDTFRDRLVLPIRDHHGQICGFIGRRNPATPDAGPKYLNTAQTTVFTKGALLFGLHEGSDALAAGAIPVLVEGPLDALAVTLASHGTHIGVAPLGTAFTTAQANQLQPFIGDGNRAVIVATDNDPAGRHAAHRAYWQLVARGDNPHHATLPDGCDPAELLRDRGPDALRTALTRTEPLAAALIAERLASHLATARTAEETVAATRAVADIIGALPPQHWPVHLTAVTRDLDTTPGALHQAVIDAGTAWTDDPEERATVNLARLGHHPHGKSPAREMGWPALPAEPDRAPVASSDIAPNGTQRTRPATQDTVGTSDNPASEGQWRSLADGIDPRLSSEADWPALEATLTALEETGYDIEHQLPRLAAVPLPEHRPALELQYRLLAEAQLPISEPTTQSQPIPGDDASSEPVPIQPTHDHRWGPSR